MFPTLLDLQKQFYQVFAGANFDMPVNVGGVDVPVISSRLSSQDYAEARREKYPTISIVEQEPRFSSRFNNDFMNYSVVGTDVVDKPETEGGADVPHRPVFQRSFFMEFPFDVHFVTKSAKEEYAFRQLMLTTFGPKGYLTFNGYPDYRIINEQLPRHQEVVEYSINRLKIDREDGVTQEVYQFTVLAWISSGDPELLPLVSQINLDIAVVNSVTP